VGEPGLRIVALLVVAVGEKVRHIMERGETTSVETLRRGTAGLEQDAIIPTT
jgi:hypothetical protein